MLLVLPTTKLFLFIPKSFPLAFFCFFIFFPQTFLNADRIPTRINRSPRSSFSSSRSWGEIGVGEPISLSSSSSSHSASHPNKHPNEKPEASNFLHSLVKVRMQIDRCKSTLFKIRILIGIFSFAFFVPLILLAHQQQAQGSSCCNATMNAQEYATACDQEYATTNAQEIDFTLSPSPLNDDDESASATCLCSRQHVFCVTRYSSKREALILYSS